jgi:hemoglobin-like flavoprotein
MSLNVELLESSFSKIKNREVAFAAHFYLNLFDDHPEVKPLFANTHMRRQQETLLESLILIVDSLRKPDQLTSTLKGLGTSHVQYGVLPRHYPMVGSTILKVFAILLTDSWTLDAEAAWVEAYAAVTQLMLDGADYPPEILNPHHQANPQT